MRRLKIVIGLLLLVLLLAGCSENPGTTTMKLMLSTGKGSDGRTLLPDDSSALEVSRFTVSGVGPNGKRFTKSSDSSNVEIEGLVTGQWTVTAKGLNRDGAELVSGSDSFELTPSSEPRVIVLDTLVGTGSFGLVLDWSLCDVANPSVVVKISGPGSGSQESILPVTINKDAKTATVSETLASGSYRISAVLKDGQQQVAGLVEAIRISNGLSTNGSHTFHLDSEGPSSLAYMQDHSGSPIRGSLSISNDSGTFYEGFQYECSFSIIDPATVDTRDMSIEWYYDGVLAKSEALDSDGSTFLLNASFGVHRLDAILYNRSAGSTGSASYTFNVVHNGEVGEMALINSDAATGISTLDADTIIAPLPGGMFLVVTPNSAKMYICTISSMALQVVKTYDSNNFEWLGRAKHAFSDPDMDYVVFTDDYGGTESFTCLRFNQGSRVLENIAGMRFQGSIPSYGIPFTNFTAAAFNPMMGMIYLSDAGTYGFDFILKESGNTIATGGTYRKKNSSYYNVSDMDVSPNGLSVVSAGPSSSSFVSASVTEMGNLTNMNISEASSSAIQKIRFINNQTVLVMDASALTSFKVIPGGTYTKYKTIGISAVDLAEDGGNYFYVADANRRLVSYSVSGYEISQLGTTMLDSQIVRICLNDGYLVALTSDNRLALFNVIE